MRIIRDIIKLVFGQHVLISFCENIFKKLYDPKKKNLIKIYFQTNTKQTIKIVVVLLKPTTR